MDLLTAVRQALLANELSGNAAAAYRFSDAGGESGLSFGITQLDVSHNAAAVKCLQECGFTDVEIAELKRKAGKDELSPKLAAHKDIIARYDLAQIKECLDHVMTVAKSCRFEFADDAAIVHAADYHNQFYLSMGGPMAKYLAALGRPVTARDILQDKLSTAWGKKEPGDVKRRYNNIVKIMGGTPV